MIINLAARNMPLMRRFVSKTLKVVIIAALFWQLVSVESWLWRIIGLLCAGTFYPLLLHPLTLNLALPYLPEAANEYRAKQADEEAASE